MNRHQVRTLAVYAQALRDASPDRIISLLNPGAVFTSPFSAWTAAVDVHAAYQARALAVTDVEVTARATGDEAGVLVWRGRIGQTRCEGIEIVTVTPTGAIARADVFLRPAAVLDEVRVAMAAAWPRSPQLLA